jgi:purine-binding chemotaxis protein CheW
VTAAAAGRIPQALPRDDLDQSGLAEPGLPPAGPAGEGIIGWGSSAGASAETTSELLVFRVGGERFAMSVEAVEGISEMPLITPLPAMARHQLGVCDLRGSLIPVYSPAVALNVRLAAAAIAIIAWAGRTRTAPGRRVVIAVDEASGVTAIHERGWGDIGGTPCTEGFVRGVSASGTELTTLLHAGEFLAACAASIDDQREETR